jgi:hypothetical protein
VGGGRHRHGEALARGAEVRGCAGAEVRGSLSATILRTGAEDRVQAPRPVLITFTLRKRAGGHPCETAFDCDGWPLPSLNEPPTK